MKVGSWYLCVRRHKKTLPGLLSVLPLRPPHSRTLEMRTRICFWQSDLLLFGHGLRLLAIGRLAWSSLTARFCLMSELARAAIFPPSHSREGGLRVFSGPVLRRSLVHPPCPKDNKVLGDPPPLTGDQELWVRFRWVCSGRKLEKLENVKF